jgi:hypothetical protein
MPCAAYSLDYWAWYFNTHTGFFPLGENKHRAFAVHAAIVLLRSSMAHPHGRGIIDGQPPYIDLGSSEAIASEPFIRMAIMNKYLAM